MRKSKWFLNGLFPLALIFLSPTGAQAYYIGGDARYCCECQLGRPCTEIPIGKPGGGGGGGSAINLAEGNLIERYAAGETARSAFGYTLSFSAVYNSKQGDASQARISTVMGYGWTHSYNTLLFSQLGSMFRLDGNGRVTKYALGAGGTYTAAPGYFETLVKSAGGSFTLRQKDGTVYRFAQVPGTPFSINGPVWRLQDITDRNNNITALTYSAGKLVQVTDTYARSMMFGYDGNLLTTVTDPLLRTTRFAYNAAGTLAQITDPEGKTVRYSYNVQAQMTKKVDKDDRVFTYEYDGAQKPVRTFDGAGNPVFTLTNPGEWAVDEMTVARKQLREYVPSITKKTDGRGNAWSYQYDKNGYITKLTAPDTAGTQYTYDPATLLMATMTDANSHTTGYEYDSQGNLLKRTDHLNFVTKYMYEPVFNMMISMLDANLRPTKYEYDTRGNRTKETDPLNGTREWTYDSHGNVLTDKDKNGNVTKYTYDTFGNRLTMTEAFGTKVERVTKYEYDVVGNMLSRKNPRLFTSGYKYDDLNRLVIETDALDKNTQTFYDGEGNRVQVIDRELHATAYRYDLRQRLDRITDALPPPYNFTSFFYDNNDNRVSTTDKNKHTTQFDYDVQNRLTTVTDAVHNVSTMTYDPVGNKLTETDANRHTTAYKYDELNRMVERTDAESNVTRMFYDLVGPADCKECTGPTKGSRLVAKQIDAERKLTFFKYDGLDRLIIQVRKQTDSADVVIGDPDDAVTRTTYDAQSNRRTMTEPNRNKMEYTYDALNRQMQMFNAAGDMTETFYDPNSNVESVIAPNKNKTIYTYDALDRRTQIDDSEGPVASFTYDKVGNRLTQKDGNGNGNAEDNEYDAIYRLTKVTDALGAATMYRYDPVGNLLKTTDREGRVTSYEYDEINRRIKMTDAQPFVTEYMYDGVGNLQEIRALNEVPPNPPQVTSYEYDKINRLITETYPDKRMRSFTYDRVGNLKRRTDQKSQVTNYTYSDLYFLTTRIYPTSPADNMTYDLSGRMLSAERGGWPVTFTYDGANRVKTTVQNGKTLTYNYDIPKRMRSVIYPGGRSIVETTDARSRLGTIDEAGLPSPIVQYSYDPGNRVVSRAYRNGTTASYDYNKNNWITSLDHLRSGPTRVAGFTHAYDKEGNKRFENKLHDLGDSEAYAYDSVYRLMDFKVGTLVGATVPVPATQTQYTLDGVGNWKVKTKDGVPEPRTHNAVNEITSINGAPVLSDFNGNTSEDTLYRYAYDEENRLTAVTRKSDSRVVGQYQYDALGRRIKKMSDPATPWDPVETRYFYDSARIVEEQNAAGTTTQATYVYGNYIDEVLTMNRAGQTYYYHQNALWSVEAITNSAAIVVEHYMYDAYGLPIVTDGSDPPAAPVPPNAWGTPHSAIGNPWMFTGRQSDEETGIYFYRARYYDPGKGRFLQKDPYEYMDGLNLYQYVRSNPLLFTDPYGMAPDRACCCAIDEWLTRHDQVMAAAKRMLRNWHAGQTWKDYGLGDLSTASGYRSPAYYAAPQCIKDAIDDQEHAYSLDALALVNMVFIGAEGYWNPLEWAFAKKGYAQGNWWLVWIGSEIERRAYFGGLLKNIRVECQNKYPGCCGAAWHAWNCVNQSPFCHDRNPESGDIYRPAPTQGGFYT